MLYRTLSSGVKEKGVKQTGVTQASGNIGAAWVWELLQFSRWYPGKTNFPKIQTTAPNSRRQNGYLKHVPSYCFLDGTTIQCRPERLRVRFPMELLGFLIDFIHPAALWPWDQPILYEKWVPVISPGGGKAAGADFLKILVDPTSWSPNGPSRPVLG